MKVQSISLALRVATVGSAIVLTACVTRDNPAAAGLCCVDGVCRPPEGRQRPHAQKPGSCYLEDASDPDADGTDGGATDDAAGDAATSDAALGDAATADADGATADGATADAVRADAGDASRT